MSDPVTRPLDEPIELDNDVPPVRFHQSGSGHSGKQETNIDKSKGKTIRWNDWGPWVALLAIVSTAALAIAVMEARERGDDKEDLRALLAVSDARVSDLRGQLTAAEARLTEAARKMAVDCTLLRNHVDVLQAQVDVQTTLTKSALKCDNWREVIYGEKR